jgi:aminoglycoside 3-N-acetyltransferase
MTTLLTRRTLAADIAALGVREGVVVFAHAALRRIGSMLNGPDALIGAIRDVIGPGGTLLGYADWDARYEVDENGHPDEALRPDIPAFDIAASRCAYDNGAFVECLRTTPGARRSSNPGASVVALGARADWFCADHPLDYGYGEGSPFAKLAEASGKVLMAGAPYDTMTLLHHAEHLARLPNKRIVRRDTPFATPGGVVWRMIEEFNTSIPVAGDPERNHFADLVAAFIATGRAREGLIGAGPSLLVDAQEILPFAVNWLERELD